jgi:hypothetical protein
MDRSRCISPRHARILSPFAVAVTSIEASARESLRRPLSRVSVSAKEANHRLV